MNRIIDLRSDTITKPSDAMRQAMYQAEVGDDVYVEDPTVIRLEQMMAEQMGMEAGLFVTSGTQGNLAALLTHCPRGAEVIMEARAHIFAFEVGGLSALGGLIPVLVEGKNGVLDPERVKQHIRAENVHFPSTGLICLENTHNRAGGTITPPEQVRALAQVAAEHGLPVHVDGARIMNAAVALGVHPSRLTEGVESISVCLSKGLGAPVGAVLCGSKPFIAAARKYRKMLGGGLRQVGVLAAAGIYALEHNVERLAEDHQNARYLAAGLSQIPGLSIDLDTVQTNIIAINVSGTGQSAPQVVQRLATVGIRCGSPAPDTVRMVTHLNVDRADCSEALGRVQSALSR